MSSQIDPTTLPASVQNCLESLLEKKARNIVIVDVKGYSTITDYYLIATGESSPQLRAMANSARLAIKGGNNPPGVVDGEPDSGWVVMDAFEFVVHLFLPDVRDNYALELLWRDRPRYRHPDPVLA
jgi:ribosome-associated protein